MRHVKHVSLSMPYPDAGAGGGGGIGIGAQASQGFSMATEDDGESDDIRVISQQIIDKKAFIWAFGKNKDGEIGIGS